MPRDGSTIPAPCSAAHNSSRTLSASSIRWLAVRLCALPSVLIAAFVMVCLLLSCVCRVCRDGPPDACRVGNVEEAPGAFDLPRDLVVLLRHRRDHRAPGGEHRAGRAALDACDGPGQPVAALRRQQSGVLLDHTG